jgi:uncharacterized protein
MKIFDFNIHLPQKQSPDVNEVIADDLSLSIEGLERGLVVHAGKIKNAEGINVLMFNQDLFCGQGDLSRFKIGLKEHFKKFMLTSLVDFRKKNIKEYLANAFDQGVNAIMFNSYLQKIEERDFEAVLTACRYAEERGRIVCVDGSYGTSKMFQYDNMKLACALADNITKVPIMIIHSGGYRVMEAFLLAADKKNVMLDTSFSLNYYLGSSLEKDYAFVYKKIGADRVVFGSDIPYVEFDAVFNEQKSFFNKYGFTEEWQQKIFHDNALTLAHGEW